LCFHRTLVNVQCQTILANRQHQRMPAAIVELFIIIVENYWLVVFDFQLDFHFSVLQVNTNVTLRRKVVIEQHSLFFVRTKIERNVHGFHSIVAAQFCIRAAC
jgi:hypothetical protein